MHTQQDLLGWCENREYSQERDARTLDFVTKKIEDRSPFASVFTEELYIFAQRVLTNFDAIICDANLVL